MTHILPKRPREELWDETMSKTIPFLPTDAADGGLKKELICPTDDVKRILLNPKKYLEAMSATVDLLLKRSSEIQNSKVTRRKLVTQKSMKDKSMGSPHRGSVTAPVSLDTGLNDVDNNIFFVDVGMVCYLVISNQSGNRAIKKFKIISAARFLCGQFFLIVMFVGFLLGKFAKYLPLSVPALLPAQLLKSLSKLWTLNLKYTNFNL